MRKPVKHLADCKHCWVTTKDGFKTRDNSICRKCPVYDKCVVKTTDKAMRKMLKRANRIIKI